MLEQNKTNPTQIQLNPIMQELALWRGSKGDGSTGKRKKAASSDQKQDQASAAQTGATLATLGPSWLIIFLRGKVKKPALKGRG